MMQGGDATRVMSLLVATTTHLTFLRDLTRNNERAWFLENKDAYHERVEVPMRALIANVATGLCGREARVRTKLASADVRYLSRRPLLER